MNGAMPAAAPAEPDAETGTDTETPDSITIPKSVLGNRQCKPGEKLTFVVSDVDPETGDVEASLEGYAAGGESTEDEMARYPMET